MSGLPAPDEQRDQGREEERFEEGQNAIGGRHLVNCFGGAFAGIVYVDQPQRALKQNLDFPLADELGSEQVFEIEIGKAAVGYAAGKRLKQELGVDGAQGADFFKKDALQGFHEFGGIDQAAQLDAGDRLDQYRTEQS